MAAAAVSAKEKSEIAALAHGTEPTEIAVGKFDLGATLQMGSWLIDRLVQRWPHCSAAGYGTRLRQWAGDNSLLFIKTNNGAALAAVSTELMEPAPVVKLLFLFLLDRSAESHATRLIRATEQWARGHRASRLVIDPASCDITPGRLKTLIRADLVSLLTRTVEPLVHG